jgi:hypothetical protein
MKTTHLAYTKVILSKVSFSETLFGKELRKSIAGLSPTERLDLYAWCNFHFGVRFPTVITAAFVEENMRTHATAQMPPIVYEEVAPLR